MQTLARFFGRSPFTPLQAHMAKVSLCVEELIELFAALAQEDYVKVDHLHLKISSLEHEADLTKNDIRNNLPTGLFLPIARASLLEILSLQDSIADAAENVSVLLTFRNITIRPLFAEDFNAFLHKNIDAFHEVHHIIREMDALIETSFGGTEAEKVGKLVQKVAYKEHEADLLQSKLLKKLFSQCDDLPHSVFYLWVKIIQEVGRIADISEKLANRVRMTLEIKA